MSVSVRHVPDESRYEVWVDDELAGFTAYRPQGARLAFTHTEVLPAFSGQGVATELIAGALDDVRASGRQLLPFCPFVQRFVRDHADYLDLVPADQRPRFDLPAAGDSEG